MHGVQVFRPVYFQSIKRPLASVRCVDDINNTILCVRHLVAKFDLFFFLNARRASLYVWILFKHKTCYAKKMDLKLTKPKLFQTERKMTD